MLYVGIDVASDKHDFNIISSSCKQFKKRSITVSNDQQGYKKTPRIYKRVLWSL